MTITGKLRNQEVWLLARYISCNCRENLGQLGLIFGVHRKTIQRYIRSISYVKCIARKKTFLNAIHRAKRLAFAHRYKHLSVYEWKYVIWTNESSFEVGKYHRQVRAWMKVNKNFFGMFGTNFQIWSHLGYGLGWLLWLFQEPFGHLAIRRTHIGTFCKDLVWRDVEWIVSHAWYTRTDKAYGRRSSSRLRKNCR